MPELRALCTLIGPAGVALLDRQLLKVIARYFKSVKEVLMVNQVTLHRLAGSTEQSVWLETVPGLRFEVPMVFDVVIAGLLLIEVENCGVRICPRLRPKYE